MNRLFEDFARRFELDWPSEGWPAAEEQEGAFVPRMNVSEDEQSIEVSAELPGLEEKDVEVALRRDSITISGEKKREREEQGRDRYRMERVYGAFRRTIALHCEVQADKASATFRKGVLTITLPKSPQARRETRRIAVKGE